MRHQMEALRVRDRSAGHRSEGAARGSFRRPPAIRRLPPPTILVPRGRAHCVRRRTRDRAPVPAAAASPPRRGRVPGSKGRARRIDNAHSSDRWRPRHYNTRVSLKGAVRYAWQSLTGGGGGSMLKVGDPAPDFEVTDHRGRRVKLKDFRGKKLVLWFFPKADTPG